MTRSAPDRSTTAASTRTGRRVRGPGERVGDDVRQRSLEQRGVRLDSREGVGHVDSTCSGRWSMDAEGGRAPHPPGRPVARLP
jgi:hypothetical protein